jgi:putative ABC transport system substrate-binding protein
VTVSKTLICLAVSALLFVLCFKVEAQQPRKLTRIGFLSPLGSPEYLAAFRQGMRELGYEEGQNILIEYRSSKGMAERFPELAADLVRIKADVIVAGSDPAARAGKNATKTTPIVMVSVGTDPVETGLVESYARPGGNITGLTSFAVDTSGKRLELFKETFAKIVRVAVPYDPANRANVLQVKEVQTAAPPLGLNVQTWEVRGTEGLERVFDALRKDRPDALYVPGGPLMNTNEKQITGFALKSRLPSVYTRSEAVDVGGLMSYGPDRMAQYHRAAYYVDKILKGAKAGDLPVERPTKFELVIKLKTAKQIGLTIPQSVLYRADKVIK